MLPSFLTSQVSQRCPRAAGRVLREWLPSWSGSVALHAVAICCFVTASEYGPEVWPVTRGRSSVASAPAMDARAGGLLATMNELTPPVRLETLDVPQESDVDPNPLDSLTVVEAARDTASESPRDEIERQVSELVRQRTSVLRKPKVAEEPTVVRVDPSTIRDDELLRSIEPVTVKADTPAEEKSENGTATSEGNAAEDSVSSNASAESNGAEENQLPQPVATNVAPPYPEEARAAGLQGRVTLRLRIGVDGRVESLKILKSSGTVSLDESALATVKQWRFEPARKLGRPVAMEVKTSVEFRIEAE